MVEVLWNRKGKNMNTINISDIKALKLPKRDIKVLVGGSSAVQSEYMTFGVTTIQPDMKMDPHTHMNEEEIIFILSGEGYVEIDDKQEELREGTVIKLPIGSEHLLNNTSNKEMTFVFCFNAKMNIGSYDKK